MAALIALVAPLVTFDWLVAQKLPNLAKNLATDFKALRI